MAREEVLRRRPCLLALPSFTRDLSAYAEAKEQAGESINVILVTYNRVGEGLLGARTFKNGLVLDLYQARLATYFDPERVVKLAFGEGGEMPPLNLTLPEVAEFFKQVKIDLIRKVMVMDHPTLFVVYGGEEERFRKALDLVNDVSNLARSLGKGGLAKFYLVTCNCDLAKKTRESQPVYSDGRLECIVYNPVGACGGFEDLQTIAETVLNAVPEKRVVSGG